MSLLPSLTRSKKQQCDLCPGGLNRFVDCKSAEFIAPANICVRVCRGLGGVRRSSSQIAIRIALTGEVLSAKPIFGSDLDPILGSSTRASFAGRQQVASSFSQTRIAMMAETGEMVGASFLSICVTVGAASCGPPKARNLLSSALPFNVVAHLEPTLHCMEEREEPTRSPPGTHRETSRNLHGRAGETHAEPARADREPTGNSPQTVSKTAQEPTSHHWCL